MTSELSLMIRDWRTDVGQSYISFNTYLYSIYHKPGTMPKPRNIKMDMRKSLHSKSLQSFSLGDKYIFEYYTEWYSVNKCQKQGES